MRIISWNIQWGRGADGRVDVERTIDALRAMGPADLICLQEVAQNMAGLAGGHGEDEVSLLSTAFACHEPVFAAALDVPAADGGRARFGNLILSRCPVDQAYRHLLPFPADPGVCGMQRSCVEVVVTGPAGPLRVLTTHLEYYSARQRLAQVEALRSLQEQAADHAANPGASKDDSPVFSPRERPVRAVVCGDFNCEPTSAEYRLMAAPLAVTGAEWCDAWPLVHGAVPHEPTVGLHGAEWPGRQFCCDYFWVSADLAARVRAVGVNRETAASDHQPVVLELAD